MGENATSCWIWLGSGCTLSVHFTHMLNDWRLLYQMYTNWGGNLVRMFYKNCPMASRTYQQFVLKPLKRVAAPHCTGTQRGSIVTKTFSNIHNSKISFINFWETEFSTRNRSSSPLRTRKRSCGRHRQPRTRLKFSPRTCTTLPQRPGPPETRPARPPPRPRPDRLRRLRHGSGEIINICELNTMTRHFCVIVSYVWLALSEKVTRFMQPII